MPHTLKSADNVYISDDVRSQRHPDYVFDRLVTDTLVISNTAGALSVPLSGAYGAIKLFDETSVASTTSLVTGTNPYGLYTIATTELNLSCGATPTANFRILRRFGQRSRGQLYLVVYQRHCGEWHNGW